MMLALAASSVAGCKKQNDLRGDEKVQVVVAADRKLAKKERDLLARRGNLQRQRLRLRDKRAALLSQKLSLPEDDTKGKKDLADKESQLVSLESRLASQEVKINKKLERLLAQQSGLVDKAGAGKIKHLLLARREHSVALREKEISRRESDVAKREKALADREQSFSVRQSRICGSRTVVAALPAMPRTGGGSFSRKDAEPVYRKALKTMRKKGILTVDLPRELNRLVTEVRHAVSKGDYTKAKYAADQLLASVRRIRIDRAFIGAKIARLSAAIRRNPLRSGKKAKVQKLFQQATAAYGDGRFSAANSKLNRIYGSLH